MEDLGFLLLMKNQDLATLAWSLRGTCHLELNSGSLFVEECGSAKICHVRLPPLVRMVYYGNCQYPIFKCLDRINTFELFH